MDDEREKPSWRERDKRNDRSDHRREENTFTPKPKRESYAQLKYKSKLDDMFSGKAKQKRAAANAKVLTDAYGTPEFRKVAQAFIDEHGFPEDWEALLMLLDHRSSDIVIGALEGLAPHVSEQSIDRQRMLQSKLNILNITASEEVQEFIKGHF